MSPTPSLRWREMHQKILVIKNIEIGITNQMNPNLRELLVHRTTNNRTVNKDFNLHLYNTSSDVLNSSQLKGSIIANH